MSTYIQKIKPFAFWLAEQFLLTESSNEYESTPINDREFKSTMLMLLVSFFAIAIVFKVLAS